jgi:hypothetical protein
VIPLRAAGAHRAKTVANAGGDWSPPIASIKELPGIAGIQHRAKVTKLPLAFRPGNPTPNVTTFAITSKDV